MTDTILEGKGKDMLRLSDASWRENLADARESMAPRLAFMTSEHHLLRYTAVRELPRNGGRPLSPDDLARHTGLPVSRVLSISRELEENLFFLVRNSIGEVSWAFPVTSDRTPHRLTFSTGERLFGA